MSVTRIIGKRPPCTVCAGEATHMVNGSALCFDHAPECPDVEIGTTVQTRFGWSGEVMALDCALALVVDMDDDGRPLHTAWERISTLRVDY